MDGKQETRKECRFTSNSDSAQQLYSLLCEQQQSEYRQQFSVFPSAAGSKKMISVSFKNKISGRANNGRSMDNVQLECGVVQTNSYLDRSLSVKEQTNLHFN